MTGDHRSELSCCTLSTSLVLVFNQSDGTKIEISVPPKGQNPPDYLHGGKPDPRSDNLKH